MTLLMLSTALLTPFPMYLRHGQIIIVFRPDTMYH